LGTKRGFQPGTGHLKRAEAVAEIGKDWAGCVLATIALPDHQTGHWRGQFRGQPARERRRDQLIRPPLPASRDELGALKQLVEGNNIDATALSPEQLERIALQASLALIDRAFEFRARLDDQDTPRISSKSASSGLVVVYAQFAQAAATTRR